MLPPDPNSDVGPNHIVEMVNSRFQIYDKQGNTLLLDGNGNPAPRAINQLWQGTGGGLCETTNRGDPVVLYDSLADRWMLSQFAFASVGKTPIPPYDECIAGSDDIRAVDRDGHVVLLASAGRNPSWSPDGSRIVFELGNDLWIMDSNGSNQHLLVPDGRAPDWSPA